MSVGYRPRFLVLRSPHTERRTIIPPRPRISTFEFSLFFLACPLLSLVLSFVYILLVLESIMSIYFSSSKLAKWYFNWSAKTCAGLFFFFCVQLKMPGRGRECKRAANKGYCRGCASRLNYISNEEFVFGVGFFMCRWERYF